MIPDRRQIAFHEAGHAIAHVALGVPFEFVTIEPMDGMIAHLRHDRSYRDSRSIQEQANIVAFTCLAGLAAQKLANEFATARCGARQDDANARDALYAAGCSWSLTQSVLARIRQQVCDWARRPDIRQAIARVAAALMERGTLDYDETVKTAAMHASESRQPC
jgi:hypothetical protein